MAHILTKDDQQERVIQWLTEQHLSCHGGYPHDCFIVGGTTLIVADLDDGKERNRTKLEVYKVSDLAPWYARAKKYLLANGLNLSWPDLTGLFGDWDEAFNETAPAESAN